jgi:hypothetical protein
VIAGSVVAGNAAVADIAAAVGTVAVVGAAAIAGRRTGRDTRRAESWGLRGSCNLNIRNGYVPPKPDENSFVERAVDVRRNGRRGSSIYTTG